MMQSRPAILERIVAAKREQVDSAKREERRRLDKGVRSPTSGPPTPGRDFAGHIRRRTGLGVRLIAEIKRASPSKGDLLPGALPAEVARVYQAGGAAAISVLTEQEYFRGSLDDLRAAREATTLPVLRKDFIIDEWQIGETMRTAPADAILLIVALLAVPDLTILQSRAEEAGMASLVEVHDEKELERALEAEARIIGINNRNLETFEVDLRTTERLRPTVPRGIIVVAESGIATRDDLRRMEDLGVDAVLVGEALMTSGDPAAALRSLLGVPA
jgi:indole-3-glycerol phosphate synthase